MTAPMLYLLEREDGALKLGASTNVRRRLAQLEKIHQANFVIVKTWKHAQARRLELEAHNRLRLTLPNADFSGNETYICTVKDIEKAVHAAMRLSDEACWKAYEETGSRSEAARRLGCSSMTIKRALSRKPIGGTE